MENKEFASGYRSFFVWISAILLVLIFLIVDAVKGIDLNKYLPLLTWYTSMCALYLYKNHARFKRVLEKEEVAPIKKGELNKQIASGEVQ